MAATIELELKNFPLISLLIILTIQLFLAKAKMISSREVNFVTKLSDYQAKFDEDVNLVFAGGKILRETTISEIYFYDCNIEVSVMYIYLHSAGKVSNR